MATLSLLDRLLQTDARAYVEDVLGTEDWLTVYGKMTGPLSEHSVFSALVAPDKIAGVLGHLSWDLGVGDGLPGFSQGFDDTTYHRWTPSEGIEPIVLVREFYVDVPGAQEVELVEEFQLLYNLAYVPRDETYFDVSTGTPKAVARWRDGRMEVKRKLLRQFLGAKGMHLVLFFDNRRNSALPIGDVPGGEHDLDEARDDLVYRLVVRDAEQMVFSELGTFSMLFGKKLVAPLPLERCGVPPYEEARQYVSYLIGVDEDGQPVEHTCDADTLANFFGANPGAPYFVQPVHFRREVLQKYYGASARYQVSDGRLSCGSRWGMRMDNDHADRVVVYLGDLGSIPYDEQMYWRSFNVEPDGGLSETAYRRGVLAEFADPSEPALAFGHAYRRTNDAWEAAFGWPLYLPLSADDAHNLEGLRVPLNDGEAEFDGQVMSLAKAAVDSLNEKAIRKAALAADAPLEGNEPGIAKLAALLSATGFEPVEYGFGDDEGPVPYLKGVQWLRSSGSAHKKGSTYAKAAEAFGVYAEGRPAVMRRLLTDGARVLDALSAHAGASVEAE